MKIHSIIISLMAVLALTISLQAAPIASDSFWTTSDGAGGTYSLATTSSRIYGQDPTAGLSGFTGAWGNTNDQATADIAAQTTGLTHSLVVGDTQTGSATSAGGGNTRGVYRAISSVPASDTYYFSFVMESAGNRSATLGLREEGAHDTAFSSNTIGGVSVGFSGTNINAWVNGTSTTILSSYTTNETYFALIEILNEGIGTNDTINISLFASDNSDIDSPDASVSIINQDVTGTLTHLALIKAGGTTGEHASLDEFRFGTELADVVNVIPEPTSAALLGLASLGLLARRRRTA